MTPHYLFLILFGCMYSGCGSGNDPGVVSIEYPRLFDHITSQSKPACMHNLCHTSLMLPKKLLPVISQMGTTAVFDQIVDSNAYFRSARSVSTSTTFEFLIVYASTLDCVLFKQVVIGKEENWLAKFHKLDVIKISKFSQLVPIDPLDAPTYDSTIIKLAKLYKSFKSSDEREFLTVSGKFCKGTREYALSYSSVEIWYLQGKRQVARTTI